MIWSRVSALLISGFLALAPVGLAAEGRGTVFAAASLAGVLEQIIPANQAAFSYAGSGAIARQLAAGAPADLVVLANVQWMDWLVAQNIIAQGDTVPLATNELVVIGQADAPTLADASALLEALGTGRLAIGQHRAVPAGQYAHQWLLGEGLWGTLGPRALETQNVRAVYALVARAEVPLGIVYASDAARSDAVSVVLRVPAESHAPIVYPAAALTPRGARLLAQLRAPDAGRIFRQNGFGQSQ